MSINRAIIIISWHYLEYHIQEHRWFTRVLHHCGNVHRGLSRLDTPFCYGEYYYSVKH